MDEPEGQGSRERAPNCAACVHFSILWGSSAPRACSVFGIRSFRMPSWEVYAATGKHCPAFQRKPGLKED